MTVMREVTDAVHGKMRTAMVIVEGQTASRAPITNIIIDGTIANTGARGLWIKRQMVATHTIAHAEALRGIDNFPVVTESWLNIQVEHL
jgi:hypothetical protein